VKTRAKLVPAEFLNEAGIVGAALWAERERRAEPAGGPDEGQGSSQPGAVVAEVRRFVAKGGVSA
jgi:hypothetical protein